MGIGRRQFLKLSSLAMVGMAIDPLQSIVVNDNMYLNRKLGILFHKPDTWGYIHCKDFGKLKDQQILDGSFEPIKDEVYEDFGDPICVITKYHQDLPEYEGVFSPTITLNISHKSEIEDIDGGFIEVMQASEYGTSRVLKDFEVHKRHQPFELSGCPMYEYDATYLFEHKELSEPLKVDLKVLKAEHNDYYYSFNMHQSIAANQTAHMEFEKFKQSIKLI